MSDQPPQVPKLLGVGLRTWIVGAYLWLGLVTLGCCVLTAGFSSSDYDDGYLRERIRRLDAAVTYLRERVRRLELE